MTKLEPELSLNKEKVSENKSANGRRKMQTIKKSSTQHSKDWITWHVKEIVEKIKQYYLKLSLDRCDFLNLKLSSWNIW